MQDIDLRETLGFLESFGIFALVSITYGIIWRRYERPQVRSAALGGIFGIVAVIAMLHPVEVAPGVLIDARSLVVGFAGAFTGPLGLVVALAIAAPARVVIGGAGVSAGLVSMAIAGCMGFLWARLHRSAERLKTRSLCMLALMISTHLTAILVLPQHVQANVASVAIPLLLALNFVGTLTIGRLIERERQMLSRENGLRMAADRDTLTELLNRRGFLWRVDANKRVGQAGNALLVLDIDHFKSVNDVHGHQTGDQVLKEIGARLTGAVRATDIVGRFGGEEFLVYLPAVSREHAESVAEKLRQYLKCRPISEQRLHVTASIGVCWQPDPLDLESAFDCADRALLEAKASGRDRVVAGPSDCTAHLVAAS